jgi:LacI family transcriptional regulator
MAVSMKDIALRAGISDAAVSMALRNHPEISLARRKQIKELSKEMGYRPNLLAKGLRKGKTQTIGFLTGSPTLEIVSAMVAKLDDCAGKIGYEVHTVHTKAELELTVKRANKLIGRGVDGLIISGSFPSVPPSQLQARLNFPVPTVLFSIGTPKSFACMQVYLDSAISVKQSVDHLYELGHRQIYMLRSYWKGWEKDLRFTGFREGIQGYNLDEADKRIYEFPNYLHISKDCRRSRDDNKIESATKDFVKTHPDCTAVICDSDDLAMPVLGAFTRMGIRVPKDISMVSIGNDPATLYTHPPLTAIDTPVGELMCATFDLLIDDIENNNNKPKAIEISRKLVFRQSTGPVRKHNLKDQ